MFIWLETWIRNWNYPPFVVWLQSIASDNEQTLKDQSTQKSPKSKTAVIDNDRLKLLSTAVVNDTDSSYDFLDFGKVIVIILIQIFINSKTSSSRRFFLTILKTF